MVLDATSKRGVPDRQSAVGNPARGHTRRPLTSPTAGCGPGLLLGLERRRVPPRGLAGPRACPRQGRREARATEKLRGMGPGHPPGWARCLPRPLRLGLRAGRVARAPAEEEVQGRTGAEEKSKFRFQRTPRHSTSLQRRRCRRLGLYGQDSGSAPTSATAAAPSGSTCHETLDAKSAGEEPRLNLASRSGRFWAEPGSRGTNMSAPNWLLPSLRLVQ